MMKKTLIASALLAGSSAAMAEISGNVALSSDYAWRGVSQTDNQMSISGGLDYSHDSGLYIGTWASNVDSQFFGGATDPQIELDVYGGYAGEAGPISYDLGLIEYMYPGADNWNTLELYAGGGYAFTDTVSGSAKFYYSDDFFDSGESAWRLEAGVDVSLPMDFTLSALYGHNDGDAYDLAGTDYDDWSIGIGKSVAGVDLSLTYVDTSSDGETLFGDLADSRVIFSVSKSL